MKGKEKRGEEFLISLYLDANIIVAYYFLDDSDNQHPRILKCLRKMRSKGNIFLVASRWTVSETESAIIKKTREMAEKEGIKGNELDYMYSQANLFMRDLWEAPRLGNMDFEIREIDNDISAEYLLINVGRMASLGNYKDALHCVIMDIFGIKYILTFDDRHFRLFERRIENIKAINPDDIDDLIYDISQNE